MVDQRRPAGDELVSAAQELKMLLGLATAVLHGLKQSRVNAGELGQS
jgi:hypothetical protein